MIKQLQANQLALTQGLNQNRLPITEGFDKMDEVKRWDMQQLPGFEATEGPKKYIKFSDIDLSGISDISDDDAYVEEKGATKGVTKLDIEKKFDDNDRVILGNHNYPMPDSFF